MPVGGAGCAPANKYIYIYCARLNGRAFFLCPGRAYKKRRKPAFYIALPAIAAAVCVNTSAVLRQSLGGVIASRLRYHFCGVALPPGRGIKSGANRLFIQSRRAGLSVCSANRGGWAVLRGLWRVLWLWGGVCMGSRFVAFYGLYLRFLIGLFAGGCFICLLYPKKYINENRYTALRWYCVGIRFIGWSIF